MTEFKSLPKSQQAVRVFAPATVANVAVGYDILGFAIEGPGDEIIARYGSTPGLCITKIHGTTKKLPRDPEVNTAGYGALQLLSDLGKENLPIELEIYKKMPIGSGMGSSAASAAAGVMAVNELIGRPLSKAELVPYAVQGESAADGAIHGDNVIPSLLGGIVLIRDNASYDYIKLPVPRGLTVFIIYPEIEILTKDARAVLSDQVSLANMIKQTGNIASFVASLYTSNLDLMKSSLVDHVIEPQRAQLIPHFYEMKKLAMDHGAMNYTISGAGPSMFGIAQNTLIADDTVNAISSLLRDYGISHKTYQSPINTKGTFKM